MSLVSSSSNLVYNDKQYLSSLNKKVMTLPRIEHPSKLINEQDKHTLDIRGKSRDGFGDGKLIRSETSTPELTYHRGRRRSSSLRNSSKSSIYSEPLSQIPENVNVIYGEDRDKVRLPIFGHRTDSRLSSNDSENDKESSIGTSRFTIDELETILKEKVRTQIHDIKTKFRHVSDFDSNGKISRQALQHLVATIFGTQIQIAPNQIEKLLEKLHLKHFNKISFDEFLNSLLHGEQQLSSDLSRQSSKSQEFLTKRTAAQMFIILKDKVRTKHKDLVNLCPSLDGGPLTRIFKTQFHNTLIDMGYRMNDKEFDKLWDKFDTDGFHAIHSDKFLKRLTNEEFLNETPSIPTSETHDQQTAILKATHMKSSHSDSQLKISRLHSSRDQLDENQIELWLHHKFPRGYSDLERSCQRSDMKQTGTLSRDQFVEQLKQYGLILDGNILESFLKRFNIDLTLTNGLVPYKDVINAFKQRSDSPKKQINHENSFKNNEEYRQTSLEKQIDYLLSINYDKIRDELTRLDNLNNGTINTNDMKSLIEDLLEFPLRPDEYYQLIKQFPMDQYGKIKYKDYLKQVLDRTNSSQQQQQQEDKLPIIPQWEYMRSKNIRESLNQEHIKNKKREKQNDFNEHDKQKTRSIEQLREILKIIIRNRYKDIEDEFKKLDRGSYGELTQDLLYDLFKNLDVKPEISRSEIVLLWSRCHLKENGHLDFYQFLREFGYSKRSAHFPNAKQNPPKRGDADFLLTSRKLYGDSVLVHGTALNAIRSNWDQLRKEFAQLDPYKTGFVQSDEFDEILTELCSSVNQDDLDMLKYRFETKHDSRMNYVRFLKHHAPLSELVDEIELPTRKTFITNDDYSPKITINRSNENQLENKIRQKLRDSYKELRRSFKQHDPTNHGSIPIQIFKKILHQFKCTLNDEEFYQLASQLDIKMDGNINYNYFIQQYVKNY
ncbi:unnamed protein product [Rotaria magnacalcarata]|uniref:EF-hand domain-containing protein n=2 Tax=Rotaria magnacalcarata TaxID=392030 RepID=A0A819EG79_9BILA|nr:unnamed protein product [Rotaria magnacalcarata]CAF2073437.1 unnamed protein product [Rotaria magnacalcarata]CAF2243195.1 unnamed protein product [Rotaria magnacalcarata]CAF3850316.1 unnamed protein product [Rotaria magnacalcarata]CAF3938278.1 unnamed protein product [Rotaria magnacalcarata]